MSETSVAAEAERYLQAVVEAEPQEAEEVAADVAAEPPPTPEPAPTAPPEPPAVRELPDATAQPLAGDAEPTPCEIAADELPQVGE